MLACIAGFFTGAVTAIAGIILAGRALRHCGGAGLGAAYPHA
jgi:hypothetical protein